MPKSLILRSMCAASIESLRLRKGPQNLAHLQIELSQSAVLGLTDGPWLVASGQRY